MPQYTNRHRIPCPLASERVADYPSTARAAAEKIDSLLPRAIRAGSASFNVGANAWINFTISFDTPMPSTGYTVVITPSGPGSGSPELINVAVKSDSITTTGFAGRIKSVSRATQPVTVSYIAILL